MLEMLSDTDGIDATNGGEIVLVACLERRKASPDTLDMSLRLVES